LPFKIIYIESLADLDSHASW